MKRCIACAEEIQEEAVLCRFCKTRQDDPSFTPAQPAIEAREPLRSHDGQLSDTDAEAEMRIFWLASLVVVPSLFLILLDPSLRDDGAREGFGNFFASVGGWAILGVLTTAVLFAIPAVRTTARRPQLKALLLSFSAWAAVGLIGVVLTVALGLAST